jgi:hypothetical protein
VGRTPVLPLAGLAASIEVEVFPRPYGLFGMMAGRRESLKDETDEPLCEIIFLQVSSAESCHCRRRRDASVS